MAQSKDIATDPKNADTRPASGPLGRQRGLIGLWAFVGFSLVLLTAAFAFALYRFGRKPQPPFLKRRAAKDARARKKTPLPAHLLRLAGSGSNLPLTRRLAQAFAVKQKGATVVVHESIGSGGGIRAAFDGAVHLGLVSRPLAERERRLNLKVIPYARVAVVVAAHPSIPVSSLNGENLLSIYKGKRTRWSDGSRLTVLQRERGDSSHLAFSRALSGFGPVDENARKARRWKVLYSDGAMQEALMSTPGAVGLFDLGAVISQGLPLKVLSLDGVEPTNPNVTAGRYPYSKDLSFVSPTAPSGLALEFIRYVFSEEGKALMVRNGYIPLKRPGKGAAL
jgi:phosphate transport system substrate-binding protein